MSYLEVGELPSLRSPVLVMACGGWNDAGQSATSAVRFLIEGWSAQRFASINPEEFFDFTSARPTIHIAPDQQRELEWPSNAFFYKADSALSRDFIFLLGTEPHLKWRAFSGAVLEVAQQCGVTLAMGLGALLSGPPPRPAPSLRRYTPKRRGRLSHRPRFQTAPFRSRITYPRSS